MHYRSPFRRRPSGAMAVALVALFVALGGASWAATSLPANSVGTAQLRNNAVTFQKIAPHTIGAQRINQSVVQVRVGGFCFGTKGAIGSVRQDGSVSCNSTLPDEFGAVGQTFAVGTGSTTVATKNLPGPSVFMDFANVQVSVSNNTGPVGVGCQLSVGSANQFRNITVPALVGGANEVIPLELASGSGTARVSCSTDARSPTTVSASASLNAIQTNSNS